MSCITYWNNIQLGEIICLTPSIFIVTDPTLFIGYGGVPSEGDFTR